MVRTLNPRYIHTSHMSVSSPTPEQLGVTAVAQRDVEVKVIQDMDIQAKKAQATKSLDILARTQNASS